MAWFKVDDKLHEHKKGRDAGKAAMGVWVLAGSYCADNLTDGFVAKRVLSRWGTTKDASALVLAGLWTPGEHEGEFGWWFHDWEEFQPSKAKVERDRAEAKERMRRLRSGERSPEHAPNVRDPGVHDPVPSRPVPALSVVTTSSQSSQLPAGVDEDGLERIAQATRGPRDHAIKVAHHVLARAAGDVKNPVRYVLKAIELDPEDHRYRRGNPRRDQECPDHPGEWADYCRIHMSEGSA